MRKVHKVEVRFIRTILVDRDARDLYRVIKELNRVALPFSDKVYDRYTLQYNNYIKAHHEIDSVYL